MRYYFKCFVLILMIKNKILDLKKLALEAEIMMKKNLGLSSLRIFFHHIILDLGPVSWYLTVFFEKNKNAFLFLKKYSQILKYLNYFKIQHRRELNLIYFRLEYSEKIVVLFNIHFETLKKENILRFMEEIYCWVEIVFWPV